MSGSIHYLGMNSFLKTYFIGFLVWITTVWLPTFQNIPLCNQKYKAYRMEGQSIFNIHLVIKIVTLFASLNMFRKDVNMDLDVKLVQRVKAMGIVYVISELVVMKNQHLVKNLKIIVLQIDFMKMMRIVVQLLLEILGTVQHILKMVHNQLHT